MTQTTHRTLSSSTVLPVKYEIPSTRGGIFLLLPLPIVVVSHVSILTTMQMVNIQTIFLLLNSISNDM